MKIVFLAEWDPYKPSGVLKKIESQVEVWRNLGNEVFLFFVSPVKNGIKQDLASKTEIFSSRVVNYLPGFLSFLLNKLFTKNRIIESVRKSIQPQYFVVQAKLEK